MKITRAQFDAASNAAFDAAEASPDEVVLSDRALLAFAAALGIEIEQEEWIWMATDFTNARLGDVVRPAGSNQPCRVIAMEPVTMWNVDDVNGGKGAQYRPGEHLYARTVHKAAIAPLDGGPVWAPKHGIFTDFPIEIRTTKAEWFVIRALGGWANRVAVINHP